MIQYVGFSYPPVGIIEILKQVASAEDKIYILDPMGGQQLPYHQLGPDCYVIISTNEGSSHRWFDRLILRLQSCGVALDHIIIRSCCLWDPDSPVKHVHTIVDECSDFVSMFKDYRPRSIQPTHHFVCLNNGHRWQRLRLTCELLNRNLQQHGQLSYVQSPSVPVWGFPIVLDHSNLSWTQQRSLDLPELNQALFNVICETAYESEPGIAQLTHHHRPGMTEKTYKCFALFQIPIWLAPYRAVACYRALGFDVFDDLVDHGYDLEPNPEARINMVVDQVESICSHGLQDLEDLKTQLLPRFEHNWARLKHFAHNHATELPQWKCCF